MTDKQYYEAYDILLRGVAERGELDDEVFFSIFEGKIRTIIRNVYYECSCNFASIDLEDICQDIFILLWKKSMSCYFLNEKYEKNASWFLGWCKIVVKNYVTTLLRRKSLKFGETLDDPDHPITVTDTSDSFAPVMMQEEVLAVYRFAVGLSSKIPMKFTWLGIYDLIYGGEAADKIEANHIFLERYSEKSLGFLWKDIKEFLTSRGIINSSEDCVNQIESALDADGGLMRNTLLKEYLGNDRLAKISDWVYKMNKKLTEGLPEEAAEWNI